MTPFAIMAFATPLVFLSLAGVGVFMHGRSVKRTRAQIANANEKSNKNFKFNNAMLPMLTEFREYINAHYATKETSGTSLAAPKVVGIVATLLAQEKQMDIEKTRIMLMREALSKTSKYKVDFSTEGDFDHVEPAAYKEADKLLSNFLIERAKKLEAQEQQNTSDSSMDQPKQH